MSSSSAPQPHAADRCLREQACYGIRRLSPPRCARRRIIGLTVQPAESKFFFGCWTAAALVGHEMKERLILIALLSIMLLHTSGCMHYARWQNERRNRKTQATYNDALSQRLANHVPFGTWCYQVPSCSKKGSSTFVWLTLGGDGRFDLLSHNSGSIFPNHWKYKTGVWENTGSNSVCLKFSEDTNRTEMVDLLTKTNVFVEFDRGVKDGIQPAPARYRR